MVEFQSRVWGLWIHWAWLPFIGFLSGLGLILSLLIIWLAQGHPRYQSGEGTVVYVSDVGAANHALFIVLCSTTAVLFVASIVADFSLRHTARIPSRVRSLERGATGIAVIFAFLTGLFCILLSIFDAFHHSSLHWAFAVTFFICLVISGIANMIEIAALSRSYPDAKHLKASFATKLFLIIFGLAVIICIAGLYGYCDSVTPPGGQENKFCDPEYSALAGGEWLLLLVFDLYILTICLDLLPTRRTSRHVPTGAKPSDVEMAQPPVANGHHGVNGHNEIMHTGEPGLMHGHQGSTGPNGAFVGHQDSFLGPNSTAPNANYPMQTGYAPAQPGSY